MLPPLAAGVVEGDMAAVEAYKSSGGDIARQLTADEVQLLNRSSAFGVGYTLVHLAIRFQRQDMLAILLTEVRPPMDEFSRHTKVKLSFEQAMSSTGDEHLFIGTHLFAHEYAKQQNQKLNQIHTNSYSLKNLGLL